MKQDMQARESGTRAVVLLRTERFDLIMRLLGCRSDLAAARLLETDPKTIYLARKRGASAKFIATVIATMKSNEDKLAEINMPPAFEEVFEVVADVDAERQVA